MTPSPAVSSGLRSALLALALASFTSLAAAEPGYLGVGLSISGEGFFLNPTIKALKVQRVQAGSPAAKAGMAEGDEIVEVEGHAVAGAKAGDLKPYMQREVGETIKLKIRKPGGDTQTLSLKLEAKPN